MIAEQGNTYLLERQPIPSWEHKAQWSHSIGVYFSMGQTRLCHTTLAPYTVSHLMQLLVGISISSWLLLVFNSDQWLSTGWRSCISKAESNGKWLGWTWVRKAPYILCSGKEEQSLEDNWQGPIAHQDLSLGTDSWCLERGFIRVVYAELSKPSVVINQHCSN